MKRPESTNSRTAANAFDVKHTISSVLNNSVDEFAAEKCDTIENKKDSSKRVISKHVISCYKSVM